MGEGNACGIRFQLLLKKRTETSMRRRKIQISLTMALAADTYRGKRKKAFYLQLAWFSFRFKLKDHLAYLEKKLQDTKTSSLSRQARNSAGPRMLHDCFGP